MDIFSTEYRRESKRWTYALLPKASVVFLVAAIALSLAYPPPWSAWLPATLLALLAGVSLAYGPVSRHPWIEPIGAATFVLWGGALLPHVYDGRFFTLVVWMTSALTSPFWIWRKAGLARYGAPSDAGHQAKTP